MMKIFLVSLLFAYCSAKLGNGLYEMPDGWTNWAKWGACSKSCNGGRRKAERWCIKWYPGMCPGRREKFEDCNTEACTNKESSKVDCSKPFSIEYRGKACHSNVYTRVGNKCDGWSRTTLDECKRKCFNNEAPSGCSSKPCEYVIYDGPNKWCQLATAGCRLGTANSGHVTYKRGCSGTTTATNVCKKFDFIARGKACYTNVYTRIRHKCDGWSGVTLDECKRKCVNNDAPGYCGKKTCKYVIYDEGNKWCQLATAGCRTGRANRGHVTYERKC